MLWEVNLNVHETVTLSFIILIILRVNCTSIHPTAVESLSCLSLFLKPKGHGYLSGCSIWAHLGSSLLSFDVTAKVCLVSSRSL